MKLILILSVCLSVAFARSEVRFNPGFQYDHQEGYNSHAAESESDNSYYLNAAGVSNPYAGYIPSSNQVLAGPALVGQYPTGNSFGYTEQHNSKEAARELAESYYKNLAINGGGAHPWVSGSSIPSVSGGSLDWTEQSSRKEAERQLAESYYKNLAVNGGGVHPWVSGSSIPGVSGGSLDWTEQSSRKEAERQLAESYYKNLAVNGGGAIPWVSGSSFPGVSGGSLDWTEQSSRKEAERQLAESYYKNLAVNGGGVHPWLSGSSIPGVSGGSLDWTEQSSRKEAERQLAESYYKNFAVNGGAAIPWVSGSAVPAISGGSLDWTEQSSRKEAERQLVENYYKNLVVNGGGALSPPSVGGGVWQVPSVRPAYPSGNSFDFTEHHSSKEAARQLEQNYIKNLAINGGLGGAWSVHPRPTPVPAPFVIPRIPTPLVGAGSLNYQEQQNSYNAIKEAENSYIRNLIVNGGRYAPGVIQPALPHLIPSIPSPPPQIIPSLSLPSISYPLPSIPSPPIVLPRPSPSIYGGTVFGLNEQSNSHSSSSESESSHSQNLQITSPWTHTVGVPRPLPLIRPGFGGSVGTHVVLPKPSVPSVGGSFDFTELMKSYQASKEAENSYTKNINLNTGGVGIVGGGSGLGGGIVGSGFGSGSIYGGSGFGSGSTFGGSGLGSGSIFGGTGGAIGGVTGGAIWPGAASYYPSREISESFRDSSSLSESDQSNYWNKLLATNQGIASESGGSQNRQKDAASDLSYDFSDRQTGYPLTFA